MESNWSVVQQGGCRTSPYPEERTGFRLINHCLRRRNTNNIFAESRSWHEIRGYHTNGNFDLFTELQSWQRHKGLSFSASKHIYVNSKMTLQIEPGCSRQRRAEVNSRKYSFGEFFKVNVSFVEVVRPALWQWPQTGTTDSQSQSSPKASLWLKCCE